MIKYYFIVCSTYPYIAVYGTRLFRRFWVIQCHLDVFFPPQWYQCCRCIVTPFLPTRRHDATNVCEWACEWYRWHNRQFLWQWHADPGFRRAETTFLHDLGPLEILGPRATSVCIYTTIVKSAVPKIFRHADLNLGVPYQKFLSCRSAFTNILLNIKFIYA